MNMASKTQSAEDDQSAAIRKHPSGRAHRRDQGNLRSTYGSYGRYYGSRYSGSRYYGSRTTAAGTTAAVLRQPALWRLWWILRSQPPFYGRMSMRGSGYRMYR
jgi:hypothetical protein